MITFLRSPLGRFSVSVVVVAALAAILVPGSVRALFSPGFFMPHVHCYLDDPRMVWLQGLSDFLIGLSYMAISAALVYLVSKARKDIPFEWMFLAFGVFIFSCGWTHFLEVWTLWHPTYWLSGTIKAVTALASLATAFGFIFLLPHVFSLIQTAKVSEQRRLQLVRTHAKLHQAYEDLEMFSYTLSHDLRAPLRAVRSLSEIVLAENRQKLGPEGVVMMGKVLAATERMRRLMQDVLELSRLSHGEVRTEAVEPEKLLAEIIQGRPDLQPPNAEVQIDRPLLPVCGDPGFLSQCLDNLLSNAVKFVKPGVKPRVRVHTELIGTQVRLSVSDNGIGVPPEARQTIFETFKRLHPAEEYDGTGLGLAIVKKAVERMGGEVGVKSEPGEGSCFWVGLRAIPMLQKG